MAVHELKTWPEYFQQIRHGHKTFEVRWDDRGFEVGDTLLLREYNPDLGRYTNRSAARTVTGILRGGQFGIEPGFVVMSLAYAT